MRFKEASDSDSKDDSDNLDSNDIDIKFSDDNTNFLFVNYLI
jgi:hypothetical protein